MSSNEKGAQDLATSFRAAHGLEHGPIKDLFELVHLTVSIDVLSLNAPDTEHGLSMSDAATGRVVIAVATNPHPMRQRSSIAHELGHVLAGDLEGDEPIVPGERSTAEIRADAFARHLLLPLDAIAERFPAGAIGAIPSLSGLSDLVQEFEVSPRLAAIQLRTLGLIDNSTCTTWGERSAGNLATTYGWGSQYRSLAADSSIPRAPQALMTRAVEAYHAGVLGITELATWYGRDAADLETELGQQAPPDQSDDWDDDAPLFPNDDEHSAS